MNKKLILPIIGLVLIAVTVFEVQATRQKRTPDAQKAKAAEAKGEPSRVAAEGRLVGYPGAEVTVGSDISGTIQRLAVQERDRVRKGDVLAEIKADDTRAALAEARARVGEAEADIRLYELDLERARSLWKQDIGTKQAWQRAERDLDAARARRQSALAETSRLAATLDKARIVAPIDGVVIERNVQPGETIAAGASLFKLADLGRTRIEAEVDEYDAARITLGAPVTISAEGWNGRAWRGAVEEIPDAVISRRLKPQDPSKPVDTRVLLVKVALGEPTPLKLGQRVDVEIGGK